MRSIVGVGMTPPNVPGHAEAGVVGDDQQHIRRALRRHHARSPPGLRLQRSLLDHAAELRIGRRELLAVDGRRGAGRARNTLLG
jgi:hypothetical protein